MSAPFFNSNPGWKHNNTSRENKTLSRCVHRSGHHLCHYYFRSLGLLGSISVCFCPIAEKFSIRLLPYTIQQPTTASRCCYQQQRTHPTTRPTDRRARSSPGTTSMQGIVGIMNTLLAFCGSAAAKTRLNCMETDNSAIGYLPETEIRRDWPAVAL